MISPSQPVQPARCSAARARRLRFAMVLNVRLMNSRCHHRARMPSNLNEAKQGSLTSRSESTFAPSMQRAESGKYSHLTPSDRYARFALFVKQPLHVVEADEEVSADTPGFAPVVVPAEVLLAHVDSRNADAVAACNLASDVYEPSRVRVEHAVVPVDTSYSWSVVADCEDEILEPERPAILRHEAPAVDHLGAGNDAGAFFRRRVRVLVEDLGLVVDVPGERFSDVWHYHWSGHELVRPAKADACALLALVEVDANLPSVAPGLFRNERSDGEGAAALVELGKSAELAAVDYR